VLGVTKTNIFLNNGLFATLGYLGKPDADRAYRQRHCLCGPWRPFCAAELILRDIKATLKRFRIVLPPDDLTVEKEQSYLDAAQAVFDHDPDTIIFIYGHTMHPPCGGSIIGW